LAQAGRVGDAREIDIVVGLDRLGSVVHNRAR
jgi:hypothetical protein